MTTRTQPHTIELTTGELSALQSAVDYYIETSERCRAHAPDEHGDETACEGWGPRGMQDLTTAARKLYR